MLPHLTQSVLILKIHTFPKKNGKQPLPGVTPWENINTQHSTELPCQPALTHWRFLSHNQGGTAIRGHRPFCSSFPSSPQNLHRHSASNIVFTFTSPSFSELFLTWKLLAVRRKYQGKYIQLTLELCGEVERLGVLTSVQWKIRVWLLTPLKLKLPLGAHGGWF